MASLHQLRIRRTKLVAQLREADAAADPETGGLTPEQQAAFDDLKRALAELEIAITRTQELEDVERRVRGAPFDGGGAGQGVTVRVAGADLALPAGFDGRVMVAQDGHRVPVLERRHSLAAFAPVTEDRASISFGGFLRALHSGPRDDMERRALAEATIGTGGAMVPTPLSLQVIDLLRSLTVCFTAGAGLVPMDSQTLRFARQIADPVGSWRAEGTAIAISDPAFDQATLTAKTWALLVLVSRELLEDGQNTDATLQHIFAKTAALALDRAILYGKGTGNSPVGIVNTPGIEIVSMGADGAPLTNRQPLLAGLEALQLANVPDCTAMVMSPRTAFTLNSLVDTLGQPLRPPPSLENIPTLPTTSASVTEVQGTSSAASSIILGDFKQVIVGMRTALQVSVLQERYADTGQVGFVLWMRADVLLQHPAAMCRIEGIL